jgi:hypothetical protein
VRELEVKHSEEQRRQALSEEYWNAIRPKPPSTSTPLAARRTGFENELRRGLDKRGYSHLESLLDEIRLAELAALVGSVHEAGWPAVWSFVYDELWSLAWEPPLRKVAETALGRPAFLVPHLAVHYVSASGEARGWHPHVDGRGRHSRLTTWVPLTDATLSNGCMYVVPTTTDESVQQAVEHYSNRKMSVGDVQRLLQHARALPAPVGSVLCWGFQLLHWGSVNEGSRVPRVSVAFEWIADTEEPYDDEQPLLSLDNDPPLFAERLKLIARAILTYEAFDPALLPFRALADELLAES